MPIPIQEGCSVINYCYFVHWYNCVQRKQMNCTPGTYTTSKSLTLNATPPHAQYVTSEGSPKALTLSDLMSPTTKLLLPGGWKQRCTVPDGLPVT